MEYAVIKVWKDNPDDCEVVDYVPSEEAGLDYIKKQKKSNLFKWEVRKYV